jgi:thioredoxin 1
MKKLQKLLIIIALLGAVAFVVEHKKRQGFACAGGVCTLQDVKQTAQPVVAETPAQKPLPRLLDLGANKCASCKMMTPVLDELKQTYAGKMEVLFIDVWESEQAAKRYGIRMIPTQIFFDAEGRELFRHEGFISKEDILAKWKEMGVEL